MQYLTFAEVCQLAPPPYTNTNYDNLGRIGYCALNDDGTATARYFLFSAKDDLTAWGTTYNIPPMVTGQPAYPFVIPAYKSGNFITVTNGSWQFVGTTLKITLGSVVHQWDQQATGRYKLTTAWAGVMCLGYGFLTSGVTLGRKLTMADFYSGYQGEETHTEGTAKNPNVPGDMGSVNWMPTDYGQGFSPGAHLNYGDPDVWGYKNTPTPPDKRYFSTLLFNYASLSNLIVYQDVGKDLNGDGFYDEKGHTKMFWCAWDPTAAKVVGIVALENSEQTDPNPNISITGIACYHQ